MSTLVALLLVGVLCGFGAAFAARVWRDGRRGPAIAVAVALVPILLYVAWLVVTVLGVGPALR